MSAGDALTVSELTRRDELEAVVDRGLLTFVEVGAALAEIRESRLYRGTHETWDAYCRDRWGWSRQRAHQLVTAHSVVSEMSTTVDRLPTSERQARELAKVPSERRREVWEAAVGLADGGAVSSSHLTEARMSVLALIPGLGEPPHLGQQVWGVGADGWNRWTVWLCPYTDAPEFIHYTVFCEPLSGVNDPDAPVLAIGSTKPVHRDRVARALELVRPRFRCGDLDWSREKGDACDYNAMFFRSFGEYRDHRIHGRPLAGSLES